MQQAVVVGADPEGRADRHEFLAGQVPQPFAQLGGAVAVSARSWVRASVRALFALRCTTLSARRASTGPSAVLGVAVACPDSTARTRLRVAGLPAVTYDEPAVREVAKDP